MTRSTGSFVTAVLLPAFLIVAPVSGQTIRGVVVDGTTAEAITRAVVGVWSDEGLAITSVMSAEDGTFAASVGAVGTYVVQVARLGYVTAGPEAVTVEEGQALSVRVELTPSPIALDAITASGARALRNEGSLVAALARRELFAQVGSRRVVVPTDVEMLNSIDVNRVLQWFLPPRGCGAQTDLAQLANPQSCGCTIVHWNGVVVQDAESAAFYLTLSPSVLGAVEYYRYWLDAPLELKDNPWYIKFPDPCAVVALWPKLSQ